jgi:hypothetical protein
MLGQLSGIAPLRIVEHQNLHDSVPPLPPIQWEIHTLSPLRPSGRRSFLMLPFPEKFTMSSHIFKPFSDNMAMPPQLQSAPREAEKRQEAEYRNEK